MRIYEKDYWAQQSKRLQIGPPLGRRNISGALAYKSVAMAWNRNAASRGHLLQQHAVTITTDHLSSTIEATTRINTTHRRPLALSDRY
jgi:hypothetical protein